MSSPRKPKVGGSNLGVGGCINFTIIVIIISWIDPLRITIMVCDDGRVLKSVPVAPIVDRSNKFDAHK